MGFLASLKKLAYGLLSATSRLAAVLSAHNKLHSARFAQFHELAGLIHPGELTNEPSLTLGITHLGNTLAVRSTRARRELGNLLIVAPTRGGKAFLRSVSFLPGLTRSSSTTSRGISSPRPQGTEGRLARSSV